MSYLNRDGPSGTFAALLASNPATPAPAVSVAHLAATVASELSHVQSHLGHAVTDSSPEGMAFDVKHAHHHAGIAAEHHDRLLSHLAGRDPEVGAELAALKAATPGDESFTPPAEPDELAAATPFPVTSHHEAMIQP